MTKSSLVQIRDVSKSYHRTRRVLSNINLDVYDNEVLALLGPTGCGKSTLLRLVARLDQCDHGEIISGEDHIEMVFQDPTLLPWRTLFGNLSLPLEIAHGSTITAESKDKIREVARKVGLEQHTEKYPHQLSGGMKMRTAFARSLIAESHILLLDEPFSSVDEITREQLHRDFLSLQQSLGLAAVLVTHDISEAVYLSDRIAIMRPVDHNETSLVDVVTNTLPYPRQSDQRYTSQFVEQCKHVHALLQTASSVTT